MARRVITGPYTQSVELLCRASPVNLPKRPRTKDQAGLEGSIKRCRRKAPGEPSGVKTVTFPGCGKLSPSFAMTVRGRESFGGSMAISVLSAREAPTDLVRGTGSQAS